MDLLCPSLPASAQKAAYGVPMNPFGEPDGDVAATVCLGGHGMELVLWLSARLSMRKMKDGNTSVWVEFALSGQRQYVRFDFRVLAFNRSAWSAAEALEASGPVKPPPGAVWLFSKPLSLRLSTTP